METCISLVPDLFDDSRYHIVYIMTIEHTFMALYFNKAIKYMFNVYLCAVRIFRYILNYT